MARSTQQSFPFLLVFNVYLRCIKIYLTARYTNDGGVLQERILHIPLESSNVPEMAGTCYEAELALSMAAWNCDVTR